MEIYILWTFREKMVPLILVVDVKACTSNQTEFWQKFICHSVEDSQISQVPTWTGCVASLKTINKNCGRVKENTSQTTLNMFFTCSEDELGVCQPQYILLR